MSASVHPARLRKSASPQDQEGVLATAPLRCLVIQLGEASEVLQSLMALRAAKQLYPKIQIHLMVDREKASWVKRVPWIEEVHLFSKSETLELAQSADGSISQAIHQLINWMGPKVTKPWDFLFNWTFTDSSSYLAALFPARVKLGYSRASDQSLTNLDGWSQYVQGVLLTRTPQNIHRTDILTTQLLTAFQIHQGDPEPAGQAPVTSKSFFHLELGESDHPWNDHSRRWMAFQMTSQKKAHSWDAKYWAELAHLILTKHSDISLVILGEEEATETSKEFQHHLRSYRKEESRVLNLVGKTDFDLWASVVGRCSWLMSPENAAIHLASVLGTRVLEIGVGGAHWDNEGPYGNGHYVVAPVQSCPGCQSPSPLSAHHQCRLEVTPLMVYETWSYASHEWAHRRQLSFEQHLAQSDRKELAQFFHVFRTKIRPSAEGGGVYYEPLIRKPLHIQQWMKMVIGHIARAWYCGWVPEVGQELRRNQIHPELLKALRELQESSQLLSKICKQALQTAKELQAKSARLKSEKIMRLEEREELRELGRKLMELDTLVDRMGRAHAPLQVFSNLSKVLMHNLKGEQISELGAEAVICYRLIGEGLQHLSDWLKFSQNLARPIAMRADLSEISRLARNEEKL